MSDSDVKFIRKNGRVIPVRGKGSAPKGSGISKRYGAKRDTPKAKGLSTLWRAAITSTGAAAGALAFRGNGLGNLAFGVAAGSFVGHQISGVKVTKKGRGESDKQLANRVAVDGLDSRAKAILRKKKNRTGV